MNCFLPTTAEEMRQRGWHQADIILITGDAYVDHPSFGVALIARLLESKGYPRRDSGAAGLAKRRAIQGVRQTTIILGHNQRLHRFTPE